MPQITRQLLRRRAEHNEGILSTLEEISLHQEELESINEVLATTCRKIKILYLQNNIIPKMENLHHMKDLQYLNLALNNITKIEGLGNCEFLNKLDLTVNFIDFDTLEESIDHLVSRVTLRDLYLLGNPAQVNWPHFNDYVIAKLPQLQHLDGGEITRSMQIKARQQLPQLEVELRHLAEQARRKKAEKASKVKKSSTTVNRTVAASGAVVEDVDEDEDVREGRVDDEDDANRMTENTPEERVKIYQELAQQKREKEERERTNAPKERDYEAEHAESVTAVRQKESELPDMEIRQKNEGGWDFTWDEDSKPGHIILEVHTPRFLDSSLIDVDVHPTYISVIIKSKLLRLRLPSEVQVSTSRCQRSKTSGHLSVIMPKVNPREPALTVKMDPKQLRANANQARQASASSSSSSATNSAINSRVKYTSKAKAPSIHELMMQEATSAGATVVSADNGGLLDAQVGSQFSKAVDVANIIPQKKQDAILEVLPPTPPPAGGNASLITELDMTALD
eukprot:gene7204-5185_t